MPFVTVPGSNAQCTDLDAAAASTAELLGTCYICLGVSVGSTGWIALGPNIVTSRRASAGISTAMFKAAERVLLAPLQADLDSVVHTGACCHIKRETTKRHGHQGKRLHQVGSQSSGSSSSSRVVKDLLLLLQ